MFPSARWTRIERAVRALAQRLAGDRSRPASSASPSALRAGSRVAERLERVQSELAEALALEHHPVVVPVGQQVAREQLGVALRVGACDLAARDLLGGAQVEANARLEPQAVPARVEQPAVRASAHARAPCAGCPPRAGPACRATASRRRRLAPPAVRAARRRRRAAAQGSAAAPGCRRRRPRTRSAGVAARGRLPPNRQGVAAAMGVCPASGSLLRWSSPFDARTAPRACQSGDCPNGRGRSSVGAEMPAREPPPLYRTSHFRVLIGKRELGFAEVGPLSSGTDLALPPEERAHYFETIVLRRALRSRPSSSTGGGTSCAGRPTAAT